MVEINNLTKSVLKKAFLMRVAHRVLQEEHRAGEDLSMAIVGEKQMRALNKISRGKNRVTNVLSFPDGDVGLGEVVLCPAAIRKDAKRYGILFEKELARVLIHGILHLLGYEHEKNPQSSTRMFAKETYYVDLLGFPDFH